MTLFLEKEGIKYNYSCLMFNLPSFLGDLVISWAKKNIPKKSLYNDPDDKSSSGLEDQIHLTIKYGILDKYKVSDIKKVLSGVEQFPLTLGKISKFEKKDKYDVLKMEVESKELMKLNKLVSSELDCHDSYPTYHPHITIGYVIPGSCDVFLGKTIFDDLTIMVKDTCFSAAGDKKKTTIKLKK